MKRFFRLYEWLGPLLLTPLAALLWWQASGGNAKAVAVALAVPIVHAYVVPGIGTNLLKVWAFDSRIRIGNFRIQHGFLFGSATASLTATLFLAARPLRLEGPVAAALATAGLLTLVNWWYDALAIGQGILRVYNQPWADGAGPVAIAGDYVLWFFGAFGLLYGGGMALLLDGLPAGAPASEAARWFAALLGATLLVPTALYILASRLRHGHSGCHPVARRPA
jgi:hypothetical protein